MGRQPPTAFSRALRHAARDINKGYREWNRRRGFPEPVARGVGAQRPHPWRRADEAEFQQARAGAAGK